ncbi:ABC transporter ATP-binding protein [Rhizobium leguminosarum]|jgi:multiple sugar transport system ATP-binding protein|uniref:Sn-glycerol-3-phosphate ABC transporter ATP-binding protein UgpC n=1 Tax=Rhizobium leguminosarum TaxID=384 RepID=A0ABD7PJV8_RHILE|nr:sn-glycerol-3-phosphate ABC transporter ATP-binding protein UgpC [Rhizobium leguminosarum]TAV64624.1 sn-glycerol-3-phosphate ABC transporter ATP-binding protein UgpC [Rhizobium leguminosarum]TAV65083.1 sn-glycerol-3-phosphate ABC transporter ATP-binding protein UgpC [Rhizobium leguminosarum]TAW25072.1 sn-glycerol-3-phosphate ABC transporter ATP-binding protein UgpC [Rhizobium leguminosarum]TAW38844.1 sn-glycerol-3-phosphate ABC transporter ATP-binding protein UgpC [Rhizobium leguminosarum]T
MADVTMSGIRKSFGALEIIKGIDISIRDGEFVTLVGPSGCGKSTLLRMIAGLEDISNGSLSIGGKSVNDLPPKERDIAMVFQSYALYPHLTVAANMSFSLMLKKAKKSEIDAKVSRAAQILGLEAMLNRYPRELSGGQRQRVAMGRAIVRDPQVFLFDEPLSNLDAKLRVHMRAEIKNLHQRLRTTTVYVTHDQIEAMTMADRVVVLNGGHVEQIGTPLELYDSPKNTFVASFIGSPAMNLLEGSVRSGNFVDGANAVWPLDRGDLEGRNVIYGTRPEDLRLAPGGVKGVVSVVEPTGSETHVTVSVDGKPVLALLRERVSLRPDEEIGLQPDQAKLHVFDAETGQRL